MKMFKFEESMMKWLKENLYMVFIIVMTIIGLWIRNNFIDYESGDYVAFLKPWMDVIKNNNGIFALKDKIGDYNQPYLILMSILSYFNAKSLYLIKLLSIIFDFVLAVSSGLLVIKLLNNPKKSKLYFTLTYIIVLLLPTVMLNSGLWAQCDSIYTSFAVLALYYLIQKKYIRSFIFLGISFSFKLQFIFLLPVFIIAYFVEKKFSIFNFLLLPLVNFIMCLPSILVGHSIWHCFTVYFEQVGTYKDLTCNLFNFWSFIPNNYDYLSFVGYGIVFLIFGIILFLIIHKNKELSQLNYIELSLLSVLICNFFLPSMHERYLYMADILAIIYFMVVRKNVIIPIGIELVSFISYMPFLFGNNEYFPFISILFGYVLYKMFNIFYINLKESVN